MDYNYGIDISHYQGNVNFAKVKASGVKFVILKVSQKTMRDSKFEEYYANAKAVGLPVGVYIYNKVLSTDLAQVEANFAVSCLRGKTLECGVWLDMEDATMKGLGKKALNNIINTEAIILQNAGFKVGIYCSLYWYNSVLDVTTLVPKYPFWIARYPSADNGTVKTSLRPQYGYIWQYSSKGRVAGINGNVDMDEANCDVVALMTGKVSKTVNPYNEPTLLVKTGARGNDAKWVQWELNQSGASLVVDGIFGTKSVTALKNFQKSRGLVADGICGPATRKALKAE